MLDIEVIDIDLAGSLEYHWRISPLRVMRDMAYLSRINHYTEGDPLRYEKLMLDDWFQRSFMPKK